MNLRDYDDGGAGERVWLSQDDVATLHNAASTEEERVALASRWSKDTATKLAEETGEPGWQYLSTRDLRRSWATALSNTEVDALTVLDWSGWGDLPLQSHG